MEARTRRRTSRDRIDGDPCGIRTPCGDARDPRYTTASGHPESVARQVADIQSELQLSGVITEMNVGGLIPQDRVLNSLRLFTKEVIPALS